MALGGVIAAAVGLVAYVAPAGTAGRTVKLSAGATADTYVSFGAPKQVRGTSTRLTAGSRPDDAKVIYLRFDVDAPADSTVQDARLVLTRDEHHLAGEVGLRAVAGRTDWDEATLTASTAPKLGTVIDRVQTDRSTTTVSFDVSSVVKAPGSFTFAVTAGMVDDVARFRSREFGSAGPRIEGLLTTGGSVAPRPPAPTGNPPAPTVGPISPTAKPTTTGAPTTTAPAPTTTAPTTTPPAPAPPPGGGFTRPTCSVSEILVPSCGRWWGIVPSAFSAQQGPAALATAERLAQRPFDVFHHYYTNDQLFPTSADVAVSTESGRNRLLFLNWKPATDMTWKQVAAGGADARIDRLAAHIDKTYPYKFFLTIWHEPENDVNATAGSGMTAADYAAMFRHTVQRLRARGVDNAVIVMNYMGYSRWNNASWFGQMYPGDDVVDWIGWDPYASGQASGYMSGDFASLVNRRDGLPAPGFYDWVTSTHPSKPIMLGEWGIFEDLGNTQGKARFMQSVAAQIGKFPKFKALFYFDTKNDPHGLGDTSLDSSATSLAAFQTLSRNPEFIAPQVVLRK